MPPTPPPPPDQPLVDDSPLERFLERAAPILAVERGINARSRVLLMAVARDVGLPEAEFDKGIRLLQRAPPQAESPAEKATEPFRRFLHAKLEQSTVKTLTPALEGRIMTVAVDKFKLSTELAREAIGQVAGERGVKRFSQADCEEYVGNLVAERLGDAEWLDDESVNRLRKAGAQWGLSVEAVDELIVIKASANRNRRGKDEKSSKLVLTVAAAAGVAIFLVVAVVAIWSNLPKRNTAQTVTPDGPEEERPTQPVKSRRPPKWWNVDLALAQSKARASIPDYRAVYDLLCSEDADERGKGYEQLVGLARGGDEQKAARDALRDAAAGSYALEPDDAPAQKLRAALLARAVPDGKKLPPGPEAYDREIWAVETALAAMYHHPESAERADAMSADLAKTLGTSLDRSKPRPSVERRSLAALAAALYKQLTAGAAESPRVARGLHARLITWSQDYLPLDEMERLDAGVLAAALPAAGDSWRDFEDLIAACIGSRDPVVVLKMLEIYEHTKNPGLQDLLGELLVLRVRARPKSSSPADISSSVREALGAVLPKAPPTARDRWDVLRGKADEALARRPPPVTDTAKSLDDTLLLAHLATLGCALAQQEPGFALFDQLEKEGPPTLAGKKKGEGDEPDSPAAEPARPDSPLAPTAAQREALARYLEGLAKYKEHSGPQRLTFVRGLAGLTERFADIGPDQGQIIAHYLLGDKPDDEQRKANETVEALAHWKSVRLGLADSLAEPGAVKIPFPLTEQLFSKALRREVSLGSLGEGWTETVREQLIRGVLADLSATAAPADDAATGHDRAANLLLELYRARARLLGLGAAQYRAAATPAAALELLIGQQAAQLGGAAPRPADAEYLARLPHELAVVEYLGSSDVRRTALAQRVYLRLLAIGLAKRRPDVASQAKALVDELAARDLKAAHVLPQVRDGEATLVRMWLLHAPKE